MMRMAPKVGCRVGPMSNDWLREMPDVVVALPSNTTHSLVEVELCLVTECMGK